MSGQIHALNGRDNGLLSWLFDESGRNPALFKKLIDSEINTLSGLLRSRGIKYDSLKTALVPSREGRQVVFLYDWLDHPGNYAVAFMDLWIPLIRKEAKFTCKSGDLLNLPRDVDEFEHVVVKAAMRFSGGIPSTPCTSIICQMATLRSCTRVLLQALVTGAT